MDVETSQKLSEKEKRKRQDILLKKIFQNDRVILEKLHADEAKRTHMLDAIDYAIKEIISQANAYVLTPERRDVGRRFTTANSFALQMHYVWRYYFDSTTPSLDTIAKDEAVHGERLKLQVKQGLLNFSNGILPPPPSDKRNTPVRVFNPAFEPIRNFLRQIAPESDFVQRMNKNNIKHFFAHSSTIS